MPLTLNGAEADAQAIDEYLTNLEGYDTYETLKKNLPDLFTKLMNVTPDAIKDKCSVYKFGSGCAGLEGACFLVYDSQVYGIGGSSGGFGVTELAYMSDGEKELLYYIYSWGSGIHRSHLGVFNFKTKEILDCGGIEEEWLYDVAFKLSDDGMTLGLCEADIGWADYETWQVEIEKGKRLFSDVEKLEFIKRR